MNQVCPALAIELDNEKSCIELDNLLILQTYSFSVKPDAVL